MNLITLFKRLLPVLFVLIMGVAAYSNTFQVPFVFDDIWSIKESSSLKSLENFYNNSDGYDFPPNRYVTYLSLAVNYHFGQDNVSGYHAVNLIVHLLTSVLVYGLFRQFFNTPFFLRLIGTQPDESSKLAAIPSTSFCSFFRDPRYYLPLSAALLFAIHPVQTQAVTYIVQRATSMATMFYLLSLFLYVKARFRLDVRSDNPNLSAGSSTGLGLTVVLLVASMLSAALAMKSKEIAFTLPFAALLYEACFFRGHWKKRLLFLVPLWVTLPIIPLTIFDMDGSSTEGLAEAADQLRVGSSMPRSVYLFTQFRVIMTYLRLLFFPVKQNLDYDYPVYTNFFSPAVFLSFIVLVSLVLLATYFFWYTRQKESRLDEAISPIAANQLSLPGHEVLLGIPALHYRLIAFGIIWFFLTLSVESSFVPIVDVIMEHRLYLPNVGAAIVFVTTMHLLLIKFFPRINWKMINLIFIAVLLVLCTASYQRNSVWGNAISLWQDVTAKSPNKGRALNNLGTALENAGRRQDAFRVFNHSVNVDPTYFKSFYNLADLYLVSDQPEKALPLLRTAIRLNPGFTEAYIEMGATLMRNGQFQEVIRFLSQNSGRFGEHPEAHFYLGSAYAFLGNRDAALRELKVVSKHDPGLANNLKMLLNLK
ncbi:MAG: tetratricopeptide repeat protein [Desulfuromusa sp.]|nr:tetratricopeptide repeat protein [Desulfuromusa sp.]